MMETKVCYMCKQEKPVSEFSRNKTTSDGLQTYCRKCLAWYQYQNRCKHEIHRRPKPTLFQEAQALPNETELRELALERWFYE